MSQSDKRDIPEILFDAERGIRYRRGKFYGKGGFAKCYEIIDDQNNVLAGKIVSKKLLLKGTQREKMTQEISIHKDLSHKNVVCFHGFFEDQQNIYIVLELCRKRSMMELHKRRKILTEPETRYYIDQILSGVHYLHENRIIHRDLKLGNLFLNDDLIVKIGDFGLATRISFEGERKRTLCGTPNYIAPEILTKNGHSFEVDVWSIGCIMYTLLVGTPPFETKSLKDTYSKIKKCEYSKPSQTFVSKPACNMIEEMLQQEPKKRPSVKALIDFEFMKNGYMPPSLPATTLTTAPRFDQWVMQRKHLSEIGNIPQGNEVSGTLYTSAQMNTKHEVDDLLNMLINQLNELLFKKKLIVNEEIGVETSDPEAHPIIWISKWVDYTDKYGFGYQLSDDCVGVMFNDNTKLILLPNGLNVHYIEDGVENYMTLISYPERLTKKMKLLSFFCRYMSENLLKTGSDIQPRGSDNIARTPYLNHWCRTTCAVVFHMTNGLVQVNFSDHNKIILCPLMQAITLIDAQKTFTTYRFSTLEKHGCSKEVAKYLLYTLEKVKKFE